MPTFSDCLKYEEANTAKNVIRLTKSGEFFRAYNRSAWLFTCFVCEYKVNRKYIKNSKQEIFYIGFPPTGLVDRIDGRHYKRTDTGYDVYLRENEVPGTDEEFEAWKEQIRIESEKEEAKVTTTRPLERAVVEERVLHELREYNIESHSLLETVQFVCDIRSALIQAK